MQIKSILLSKTFWGIAITASITIAKMLWVELIIADQTGLVDSIVQLLWLTIALYGRVTATKTIAL